MILILGTRQFCEQYLFDKLVYIITNNVIVNFKCYLHLLRIWVFCTEKDKNIINKY